MCIVCNMPRPDGLESAYHFLHDYRRSQQEMRAACAAMLDCARKTDVPDARKQYNRTHKRMVKMLREWNQIEHVREKAEVTSP